MHILTDNRKMKGYEKLCLIFLTTFFVVPMTHVAIAQGCSDAGFCTINSFKPNNIHDSNELKNQFKFGISFGRADHSISTFGNYIEYNRQLSNKLGLDVKLTSISQQGNGISAFGLSDIYLSANYILTEKTILTFGTKLPLSGGNKMKDNLSLPMDYQSSLGTIDLILGIGYEINKLQLVAALQQPLTQNGNEFIAENYPVNSKIREFQSTNKFKRSGDILLRVSYPVKFGEKFKLTPGLLAIYHLTNDKFSDASGVEKEIPGSQGLTLNGNVYLDYEINKKSGLQFNIGFPFVARDTRPDGLTRKFVTNVEYRIKF